MPLKPRGEAVIEDALDRHLEKVVRRALSGGAKRKQSLDLARALATLAAEQDLRACRALRERPLVPQLERGARVGAKPAEGRRSRAEEKLGPQIAGGGKHHARWAVETR